MSVFRFATFDASGNVVAWAATRSATTRLPALFAALRRAAAPSAPEIYGVLRLGDGRAHACFENPDGSPEMFCGNALRCLSTALVEWGQPVPEELVIQTAFSAVRVAPGSFAVPRHAPVLSRLEGGDLRVDVGTPHRVRRVRDIDGEDVRRSGLRISSGAAAVNATFYSPSRGRITLRTFERGVAHETRSCGTGAIAAALAAMELHPQRDCFDAVFPSGERLKVEIREQIRLSGSCHTLLVGQGRAESGAASPRAADAVDGL